MSVRAIPPVSERFDSGYTRRDIEMILDDLIDAATAARLGVAVRSIVARALGLDGGRLALSSMSTVMLDEPRFTIDPRLDAVSIFIRRGLPLIEALEALPETLRRPLCPLRHIGPNLKRHRPARVKD